MVYSFEIIGLPRLCFAGRDGQQEIFPVSPVIVALTNPIHLRLFDRKIALFGGLVLLCVFVQTIELFFDRGGTFQLLGCEIGYVHERQYSTGVN